MSPPFVTNRNLFDLSGINYIMQGKYYIIIDCFDSSSFCRLFGDMLSFFESKLGLGMRSCFFSEQEVKLQMHKLKSSLTDTKY
jgi:hypothetical protein